MSKKFDNCLEVCPDGLNDEFFASIPSQRGIILFSDKANRPIQLLCSASIRRAVKGRLLAEVDEKPTRKADIKDITEKISYMVCECEFRANLVSLGLAQKFFGKNWRDYFAFGKIWYLRIDISQEIPGISVTSRPDRCGNMDIKIIGPFVTRKNASDYQNALEDAFGLCKRHSYLGNIEKAKSCPYLQMDLCCGVCLGKTTTSQYHEKVTKLLAAIECPVKAQDELTVRMNNFAERLEFENAQRTKKQIESISALCNKGYAWIKPIDKLSILHIDKSAKIKVQGQRKKQQTYAMFLITEMGVKDFGDFLSDDVEKVLKKLAKYKEKISEQNLTSRYGIEDILRLAGFYMYRNNRSGIWNDGSKDDLHDEIINYIKPAEND